MSTISVREFSYNPSAVFARVEKGETIQVTRHGNVIAILSPAGGPMERYAHTAPLATGTLGFVETVRTLDLVGHFPEAIGGIGCPDHRDPPHP
ncbi:type II toxin-antitoxin system Phd/YefM family antitoxin [Streptomyces nodosus]